MVLMSSKTRRFILSVLVSVGLTATAMPMYGLPKLPHSSQPQTAAAHQELDLMLEKFFNGKIDEIPPQEYPAVNVQPVITEGNDAPENGGVENQEPADKAADTEDLITERNLERSEGVNSAETVNRSRGSASEQEGVPADAPSEKMLELLNAIEQEQLNGDPEPDVLQNDGAPSRSRSKAESSAKMQGLFNAIDYAQELDPALEKFFNGEIDEIRPYEHKIAENHEPANEVTHASRKRSREIEENIDHGRLTTSIPVTYTTVGRETEFATEIERLKSILPRKYDTTTQKETVKSAIKFIDEMNGVETVLQEPDELEFSNLGTANNAKMIYLLENLVSRLPGTFQLQSVASRKSLPGHLTRNRAIFEARHYIAALKTARKPKHANGEQKSQKDNEHAARGGERHNPDVSTGNARNHGDDETSVPPLKRLKLKLPQNGHISSHLSGQSNIPQMPTQPTNQHPGLVINSYAQSTVGLTAPPALQLVPTLQMSVPVTAANYGSINHANVNTWIGGQLQKSLLPSNSVPNVGANVAWQMQNQYKIQSIWDLEKLLPSRYNPKTRNDVLIAICDYIDESTGNKKEEISLYPKGSFRNNDILTHENFKLLYRQLARRLPDRPRLSMDSPGGISKYELMDRIFAYVASLKK